MAKLVCEDCDEVLEEGLSESEAQSKREGLKARDETGDSHDHDQDQDQSELGETDSGQPDDERDPSSEQSGGGAGGGGLNDRYDPDEIEDEVEDEFDEKLDEINDDEKIEDTRDDVGEYADAAEENEIDKIKIITGKNLSSQYRGRLEQVKRDASQLERVFRDKLRQKQKNKIHREQRSGRFDSRRMIEADRGSAKVFKRDDEGRDLKYEAYFVLDRSGSMNNRSRMESAENATATLMAALEGAGVKTELLDFRDKTPRIIKTKSQRLEDEAANLLVGSHHTGGGTPLGKVMNLLVKRVEGTFGKPFIVSVTDGKPANKERYKEAVRKADAPVLGVLIGGVGKFSQDERNRMYDAHVSVEDGDDLTDEMFELANEVMF